ncbi:hypothetical protein MGS_05016 [Candida albicans P78042]|nr:hypothetical protein MGS_05016 [Candida albicans P78042]
MFSPFYNGDYSYDQPIDFESLFDLLHQHQFYYKENTRPRVIKKLETEDEFQIQIYKPYGNYNNYEVNVVKSNPPIVNVVISSVQDNFKTVLPFNVNYIDIDNINWQWYKQQNVLVLNIPKRIHYVHSNVQDILNCLLGCNDADASSALKAPNQQPYAKPQTKKDVQAKTSPKKKEEFAKVKKEIANNNNNNLASRDANLKDSIEEHENLIKQAANALKQATENSSKQVKQDLNGKANALSAGAQAAAEAKHKEALEKTKQELEAQRKAAHDKIVKAQQELEEIARKEAEAVKLHEAAKQKELEEEKRKVEAEQQKAKEKEDLEQKEYDQFVKQQQEFLKQFFGFNLGPAIPTKDGANAFYTAAKQAKKQKPKVAPKPKQLQTQPVKQAKDEEESIPSEPETEEPESSKSHNSNENLHKHPSLEEVEDEESVMFRKRFGH